MMRTYGMSKGHQMRSIDLFSGAGGLTRGLEQAGWETIAALEINPTACASYSLNFPNVEVLTTDVHDVDFTRWKGEVDAVVGGPPCQPFSVAGKQMAHLDPRDGVPEFVRAVKETEPQAFILENVAGLAAPRHHYYLATVVQMLRDLGFVVSHDVLDAADYGVPQHRKRLFIIGMRDRAFAFPKPTHGASRPAPHFTAGEALICTPDDVPNVAKITFARNPVLRPQPWDGMLVNGGGRPINLAEPCQTIPASAGGNRTHILDLDGVLVDYHQHLMAGGQPREGDVPGVRRLTVRESARIQAFPDEHVFLGKQSSRYSQVGNAVPPTLAEAVGKALAAQLRGEVIDLYSSRPSRSMQLTLMESAPMDVLQRASGDD